MSSEFERSIQKWVSIDNHIKILNEKMRELRDEKNDIYENINSYIETNRLQNASVDISDGKLKFVQTRITQRNKSHVHGTRSQTSTFQRQ